MTPNAGHFHCRVATFSQEIIRSLKISVFGKGRFKRISFEDNKLQEILLNYSVSVVLFNLFDLTNIFPSDPGTGPRLRHSVTGDLLQLSCHVEKVFPLPSFQLS